MTDTINANQEIDMEIIVTKDMSEIPANAKIKQDYGERSVLILDDDGAVEKIIQGRHIVLQMYAKDFTNWVKPDTAFWFKDKSDSNFKQATISKYS